MTIPAGPVINIPNIGPWLAPGARIIGPKKPTEKELPPINIAPVKVAATPPIFLFLKDFQVYRPTINAIGTEIKAATLSGTSKNNGTKIVINKKLKSAADSERVE